MTQKNNDLPNIEAHIRAAYDSLTAGQQKVAQFVLTRGVEATYLSAARVAQLVGVSHPTVVRTAKALGFNGYVEFQAALQDRFLLKQMGGADRFQLDLRILAEETAEQPDNDKASDFRRFMLADAAHIETVTRRISAVDFEQAVDMLDRARLVYVTAGLSSAAFARSFGETLSCLRPNCYILQPGFGAYPVQLIEASSEHDLLVAVSFARYSQDTVRAIEYARSAGARILAISDSPLSPAAKRADVALVVPPHPQVFIVAAQLSLLNALLLAVAMRHEEDTRSRLERLDEVLEQLQVFERPAGADASGENEQKR